MASGIYFADNVSKSLYYSDKLRYRCDTSDKHEPEADAVGWILLCEIDAGVVYRASERDVSEYFELPDDYDSLLADPFNEFFHSQIYRSERMIKDPDRVRCKYLLRVKCNLTE